MKKTILIAAIVVMTGFASTANAQVARGEPGDMNLSFDASGTLTSLAPAPFEQLAVYAVLWDAEDLFGIEYSFTVPPTLLLANEPSPNPQWITPSTVNFGEVFNNVRAGTAICVEDRSLYVLQTVFFLYFAPDGPIPDQTLCMGPSQPSSPDTMDSMGWLGCDLAAPPIFSATPGVTDPNGVYPDNCIVLHPVSEPPVQTESKSWGSVKSAYDDQ